MTLITRILASTMMAATLFATAAHADTVVVNDFDHRSQVTLQPGDILVVNLRANLSTGYSWNIAQNNKSLLRPMGKPSYQVDDPGMMGGGGTQTFRFRATGSGGEGLVMLYQKPSLGGGVPAADTFRLLVVIDRPNRNETVVVTEGNDHGQVNLNIGDTLVVRLRSNQTTGYTWSVGQIDRSMLRQVGTGYLRPVRGGMGAPGTQEFRFQVVGSGSSFLGLLYQRPFESGGIPAAQRWELQVNVGGRGGGGGGLLGKGR